MVFNRENYKGEVNFGHTLHLQTKIYNYPLIFSGYICFGRQIEF